MAPDADANGKKPGQIDLDERVIGSWEPTPMSPIVDGAPVLEPPQPVAVLADEDWICLRGPCRNYHRMEVNYDAERPVDGSTTYGDGSPIEDPVKVVHTCYPAPGIEVDLGERVVFQCNRWDPADPRSPELVQLERRRARYEKAEAKLCAELAKDIPETENESQPQDTASSVAPTPKTKKPKQASRRGRR